LELALRSTLTQLLVATNGWAAAETGEAVSRARELGEALGASVPDYRILMGAIGGLLVRCRFEEARIFCQAIIEQSSDVVNCIETHSGLGDAHLWTGQFDAAVASYDQVIELARRNASALHGRELGRDPVVAALVTRSIAQLLEGDADCAHRTLSQGLARADASTHPYQKACANTFGAMYNQLSGDVPETRRLSERAESLAEEHHLAAWGAMARILRGWALAKAGNADEGIQLLHSGMEAWVATGATWGQSYFPALLADAFDDAGRFDEAKALWTAARRASRELGEKFYSARITA
jgi:tetratricopeptide (TPR) repeat protein